MKAVPVKAQPNSLRWHLHKSMSHMSYPRPLERIHASDLTKEDTPFCPRERLIGRLTKIEAKPERIGAATVATFAYGRAVEWLVVDWFAAAGMAIGDWQCVACKSMVWMQPRPHGPCPSCNFEAGWNHVERRFMSRISGISCGVDLLVRGVASKLRAVEIKSMLKESFKPLAGPLAEHKLRTNLYMRIISESADEDRHRIDTEEAHVIYVCKGGYVADSEVSGWAFGDRGFTPFRDYRITRDDKQTDPLVAGPVEYCQAVMQKVIPTGLCTSIHAPRATRCSVALHCFSGTFPAGKKFI